MSHFPIGKWIQSSHFNKNGVKREFFLEFQPDDKIFTIIIGMLIPSFQKMGTGKILYSSFKVQSYFPIQGKAVVVKKNFPIRGFTAHGKFFFHYSCAPFMGKYDCTFHDSQGIFISHTRGFAAHMGNIPSPFFEMMGLGHFC